MECPGACCPPERRLSAEQGRVSGALKLPGQGHPAADRGALTQRASRLRDSSGRSLLVDRD